jgi:hypothetical protein
MQRTLFTVCATSATLLAAGCASVRSSAAGDGLRLSVVARAVAEWHPFRSAASHFGIEFPAEPAPESWSLPGASVAMVAAKFADASYVVSVVDAREAFATPEGRERALETYPAEMVTRLQGAVVSDERRNVGGWPARSVEIAADRGVTRVLVVPTPERLYLVGVATRGEALPGETARFMESFRLRSP